MTDVLTGRTAIVTGGSHGLGLEIARTFVASGARVLVCARDATALDRARTELESIASDPNSVATTSVDVSEPDAVERLVGSAIERFSRVDVLVNNAGVYGPKGLIDDVAWDEWEQAVRVNLFGSVLCSRAVLPHFRANGYGKIIQLSGGGATSPLPRLSAYAASKAAVVRFAETLAEELRGTGIDVNAIAPGALNTRLLDEVLEAGPEHVGDSFYERALEQQVERRHPARRRGTPRRLPRVRGERRDHGQADQRAVGSVGGTAFARRRSPHVGRLHAAPHRPGRSQLELELAIPTFDREQLETVFVAPMGREGLPPFDRGWLVAPGRREPFLVYADDPSANWSEDLERLHDQETRDPFSRRLDSHRDPRRTRRTRRSADDHRSRLLKRVFAGRSPSSPSRCDIGRCRSHRFRSAHREHPRA